MHYKDIDNLSEEEIQLMYGDVLDNGDTSRLACCWCGGSFYRGGYYTPTDCSNWCRSVGQTCLQWDNTNGSPYCFGWRC